MVSLVRCLAFRRALLALLARLIGGHKKTDVLTSAFALKFPVRLKLRDDDSTVKLDQLTVVLNIPSDRI